MANPRQYKIPDWFLNRQKDIKDGKFSQVSGCHSLFPSFSQVTYYVCAFRSLPTCWRTSFVKTWRGWRKSEPTVAFVTTGGMPFLLLLHHWGNCANYFSFPSFQPPCSRPAHQDDRSPWTYRRCVEEEVNYASFVDAFPCLLTYQPSINSWKTRSCSAILYFKFNSDRT